MLIELTLCFDDETGKYMVLNKETGEIREFTAAKKSSTTRSKKKAEDTNPNPQITLEDNKYILNQAAATLMGVEPDDRLCIKMKKVGGAMLPIIGTTEAFKVKDGNRITQKLTVACRGANHDALEAYGNLFDLEANPELEGTFIMRGDKGGVIINDDNIAKDVELPEDLKIDLGNEDELPDVTDLEEGIDSSIFENLLNNID